MSPLSWRPWRTHLVLTERPAADTLARALRLSGLRESRVLAVAGRYRVETRERHGRAGVRP
jgi:hypothetical protein